MKTGFGRRTIGLIALAIVAVSVVVGSGTPPVGIGIIGGADGPTSIYLSNGKEWGYLLAGLLAIMGGYAYLKKKSV